MAHINQQKFCVAVRTAFPEYFKNKRVLDIGSLDINGSNRPLFVDCDYLGVDIGPGRNVDIVAKAHELDLPDDTFDVVISTECFEHDKFYRETLQNACRMLKPGGLLLFTCASTGREEHGTVAAHADSSPFTSATQGWDSYYKNLTEEDVREAIDVERLFTVRCRWTCGDRPGIHDHTLKIPKYQMIYCDNSMDLYFWGIKGPKHEAYFGDMLIPIG
jgi:SAM-dependent methyltransferase